MPKQQLPKSRARPATNGRRRGKPITVADTVLMQMGMLPAEEKAAVEEVLDSPARLRDLLKEGREVGSGGQLVADISPAFRIVFRDTPKEVRLVELMAKRAFDELGIVIRGPRNDRTAK